MDTILNSITSTIKEMKDRHKWNLEGDGNSIKTQNYLRADWIRGFGNHNKSF